MSIRASVIAGRLVVAQETTLPEGTVLDLVADDEGDDLLPDDVRRLNEALERSIAQVAAGQTADASEVLRRLSDRR